MGVLNSIPIIGDVIDTIQKGFNLTKDINNTDNERSVDAQKELMAQQDKYQRSLADFTAGLSQKYQLEQMAQSNEYNIAQQRLAQDFNVQNMNRQFHMNDYLTSVGRQASQMRQAGLNPADLTGGGSGSVSAPSSPALGSSPLGVIPSTGSFGTSFIPTTYTGHTNYNYFVQKLTSDAINREKNAKARLDEIDAITRLDQNIVSAKLQLKQLELYEKQGLKFDAEKKALLDTLPHTIAQLEAMKEYYTKSGFAAEKTAENDTRKVEETIRHNQVTEAIQRVLASSQIKVNAASVDELTARASQERSSASLTQQEILWYADKAVASIELTEAERDKAKQEAARTGKDVEYYEWNFILNHAEDLIRSIAQFLPASQVGNIVSAIKSKPIGFH